MHRLYRLQQRLAITTPEASALLFLIAVLLTGFVAGQVQSRTATFGPSYYAELHADFAARSEHVIPAQASLSQALPVVAIAESARVEPSARAAASRRSREKEAEPVRMNINTASASRLQRLPRIGPKMAERIIAYREAHGPFAQPSHLVRVRGIGPKTFAQMEPYVFVD